MGRPARIDLDAIADAVVEIGFDEVTMKRVAEHLGVSVPGLYHHVSGKDDLIRLAADRQLAAIEIPTYVGQDWESWLREWGRYIYRSMSTRPELFELYMTDGLDPDRAADTVAEMLEHLIGSGLDPALAYESWETVSTAALGAAAFAIRQRTEAANGEPWRVRLQQTLLRRDELEGDAVVALGAAMPRDPDAVFERRLDTVFVALRERVAAGDR